MSARITPESPPPEEKFAHGKIRMIPLVCIGDGARDPRKVARNKLPLFEVLLLDGWSEAYRAWNRQKRISKPRKRRATSDLKGLKKLSDPRFDPDFDAMDLLGLNR